ncbi:uncharacterized protein LOC142981223 [Anticarsia gemmatalis]|uniref:uncharacterized protein LOC142981223 n=1 Tax=Anticarsia gemmatalis TaxID=129554 RepID=UPI003F75CBFB
MIRRIVYDRLSLQVSLTCFKMKIVIFVLSVALLVLVEAGHEGNSGVCPPGEHPRPDCPQYYEPWCTNPTNHPLKGKMGRVCPKPPCFCDEPNVRDYDSGRCMPLSECPSRK